MARKPRVIKPGYPHHIITRGNNRRRLFSYSSDRLRFLRYLGKAVDDTGVQIGQLTLMPNHMHMIATPPSKDAMSLMMKKLNQRYARARNNLRDGSGKLFEERYWSRPIEKEAEVGIVTAYNDCNALRAGLVARAEDDPWSTCAMHVGANSRIPAALVTLTAWYMNLGRDADGRAAEYREFLRVYLKDPQPPPDSEEMVKREREATEPYSRRIERPDGSSARDATTTYRSLIISRLLSKPE